MFSQFDEDQDYELNARYDYNREAYADMILDNEREAYYDYCDECREEGATPLEFNEWKQKSNKPAPRMFWDKEDYDNCEEREANAGVLGCIFLIMFSGVMMLAIYIISKIIRAIIL